MPLSALSDTRETESATPGADGRCAGESGMALCGVGLIEACFMLKRLILSSSKMSAASG